MMTPNRSQYEHVNTIIRIMHIMLTLYLLYCTNVQNRNDINHLQTQLSELKLISSNNINVPSVYTLEQNEEIMISPLLDAQNETIDIESPQNEDQDEDQDQETDTNKKIEPIPVPTPTPEPRGNHLFIEVLHRSIDISKENYDAAINILSRQLAEDIADTQALTDEDEDHIRNEIKTALSQSKIGHNEMQFTANRNRASLLAKLIIDRTETNEEEYHFDVAVLIEIREQEQNQPTAYIH